MAGRLTVGSLRGLPQPGLVRASGAPRRGPIRPESLASAAPSMPKRCCGSGCAGCPVGERLRALRAARSG